MHRVSQILEVQDPVFVAVWITFLCLSLLNNLVNVLLCELPVFLAILLYCERLLLLLSLLALCLHGLRLLDNFIELVLHHDRNYFVDSLVRTEHACLLQQFFENISVYLWRVICDHGREVLVGNYVQVKS